jgi:type I restriction enzyme S subunit
MNSAPNSTRSASGVNAQTQVRTYKRAESVVFSKTKEAFGGLSNMAAGFPINVNGARILTSEALYQACRFPHLPQVQRLIIQQSSPMTAKMKSKPYRKDSRSDWERVRVKIMRWCLRVKLAQNWSEFSRLLLATGDRAIVEESRRDGFWGAKVVDADTLTGMNVLGRLLMELREEIKKRSSEQFRHVEPVAVPNFLLFGEPILSVEPRLTGRDAASDSAPTREHVANRIQCQLELAGVASGVKNPLLIDSTDPQIGTQARRRTLADGLQPYAEYKESGLPWLGELPAHWQTRRAKCFLREVDDRSQTGKEVLLSVSHLTGVTPRSEKTVTMFLAKSNVGHKICRPDDVVINTLWAWMAALGVTKYAGIVSPAYGVYRPLAGSGLLPQFADQLLRTPRYAAEYLCRSTGVNSSRMRLYPEQFLRIPLVYPPPTEQAAIVRFLDHANRRFDRFIRAKKKQVALLGEVRQSVTEDALCSPGTRGVRLGVAAELVKRELDRQRQQTYTPIGLFNRGRGIFHKEPTKGADLGDSNFFWIEEGDLVLSGQFAWEGAIALASSQDTGCVASHRYSILRGRSQFVASAVLLAFFKTQFGALLLDQHSRGAAGRNRPLNTSSLLKEKIPVPPLSAQQRIIELVLLEARLADSVSHIIEAVREYRTRLAADVVMGKLDVREAAARLPDEIQEPEPLDADTDETEGVEAAGEPVEAEA